ELINVSLNDDYRNLDSNENIMLEVNDNVIIRSKQGYKQKEFVLVTGLVNKPGYYAVKNNTYSVFDIIKDFEGFLPDAEINGVKIKRPIETIKIEEIKAGMELDFKKLENDSINIGVDKFIEIGLNIERILKSDGNQDQYNLSLKGGDEIIVPKFDNSIEISGEVQQPTAVSFYRGISTVSAINAAGGFGLNAKKAGVYVIYQNGSIATTKKFLFFKNYPKLLPGAKIFVPTKSKSENKTSVAEIVGYTTSLVSIIALIKSL
ncbi:MAG: SLBB domain-containing protein, partial [Flavobacteriaceae bacterium]